jgi:hypothetical protein
LNPRQHQSGTSIDRVTRISKIGNAAQPGRREDTRPGEHQDQASDHAQGRRKPIEVTIVRDAS